MIMPATLALVQCLLVESGNQLYAIESAGIRDSEVMDVDQTGIATGRIECQGESLPLVHLGALLDHGSVPSTAGKVFVWQARNNGVARSADGQSRYALLVDSVRGHHESLVRSLGRHAARWTGVCGAAELFDGNVVLMLDIEELMKAREAG